MCRVQKKVTRDLLIRMEVTERGKDGMSLIYPDGRQLRIFVTDTLTLRFVFSALLTKLSGFTKILFPSLASDRASKIQQVVFATFGVSV